MAGNVGEKIVADPHFWNFGKLTDILADIRYWSTQAKGPTLTIRDGPFALWRAVWDEKVQGILYGLESERNCGWSSCPTSAVKHAKIKSNLCIGYRRDSYVLQHLSALRRTLRPGRALRLPCSSTRQENPHRQLPYPRHDGPHEVCAWPYLNSAVCLMESACFRWRRYTAA